MAYTEDEDLQFLFHVNDKDLDDLVYILTKDENGNLRLTENLSANPKYKMHYPRHSKYQEEIIEELQKFGANSFTSILGFKKSALYRDVLIDVCSKFKVNLNKNMATHRIEEFLLFKVFANALNQITNEEYEDFIKLLVEENFADFLNGTRVISKDKALVTFQEIFKESDIESYKLTIIIVNTIFKAIFKRVLSISSNDESLVKFVRLMNGVNRMMTSSWSSIYMLGTSTKITIPAVFYIILLRQKYNLARRQ